MTFSLIESLPSVGCCVAAVLALCCAAAASEPLFKGGEPIPADAIVLFDGKDLSKWTMGGPVKAPTWIVENGYTIPRDADICSKQLFKDCQLHVEFWLPKMADDVTGQARANSGVFFMGFVYEIQVLDSYGLKPEVGDCAAMYSIKPPDVNAARPPETWQTYDAIFHAPKFDASGKKIANARITLFWNGVMVHDNFEIPSATPDHNAPEPKEPGPIQLQWHGNDVRFRNVWVRPL
jgi:hypothetical protein